MNEDQIKLFLSELGKLTRKYGIEICGCGCCGSPFLGLVDNTENKIYGVYNCGELSFGTYDELVKYNDETKMVIADE